jgi:hypothetical protein
MLMLGDCGCGYGDAIFEIRVHGGEWVVHHIDMYVKRKQN